jgi:glycosyltransferase involved in cell wall biosynthesis
MPEKPQGLLLSAYDAGSHRYWRKGIEEKLNDVNWTVLTLPARYFNWRIRGNPISFIEQYRSELSRDYDFVIATSMVDLATLRGLIPTLASTPSLIYFHENQFEYPQSDKQNKSIEPQMVNLYSALAADQLIFNSEFNRSSFFKGCDELMAKLPDFTFKDLSTRLLKKSSVIPVPIADEIFSITERRAVNTERRAVNTENNAVNNVENSAEINRPIKLIWNHRWEYDKGVDRLLEVLRELERREIPYKMCILGERFRSTPPEMATIQRDFEHRLVQCGYEEDYDKYKGWLTSADMVISTAIHEFQGISVLEAVARGCIPVLPNRLAYPGLVSDNYLYDSFDNDIEREAKAAVDRIERLRESRAEAPNVSKYKWSELIPRYRDLIQSLLKGA